MRTGVLLLFSIALSLTGYAQGFFEPTSGPEGGNFFGLVAANNGTLFVGDNVGRMYRSTDDGHNWHPTSRTDMELGRVTQIIARPNGTVLAVYDSFIGDFVTGTWDWKSWIFRSDMNGDSASWREATTLSSVGRVNAVFSGSGSTVIAATDSGVYRSTDDGINWERVLDVVPAINGAGSVDGELYVLTWRFKAPEYLDDKAGVRCWHSTDDGKTWSPIGDTLEPIEGFVQSSKPAAISPNGTFLIATKTGTGVLRLDRNANPVWATSSEGLPPNTPSNLILAVGNKVYVATDGGIFRSDDDGRHWVLFAEGHQIPAYGMTASEQSLFISSASNLYRSDDDGTTWSLSGSGIVHSTAFPVIVSKRQTLIVSVGDAMFRSTDRGDSWTQILFGIPKQAYVSTIAVGDDGTLLAGISGPFVDVAGGGGSIFRSTDDGLTWDAVNIGLVATQIDHISHRGGNWFAATDSGLYRSTNNGDSWNGANTGLPTSAIRTVAVTSDGGIVGTYENGMYRSTDNGATWHEANEGNHSTFIRGLLVTPAGTIFASADRGNNLYRSIDNGLSWTDLSSSLPPLLRIFSTASNSAGQLFLSAVDENFNWITFRSDDNGVTWQVIDTTVGIVNFAFDTTGRAYVGTYDGVWRSVRSTTASLPETEASNPVLQLSVRASEGIVYRLPETSHVRLALYNTRGRFVKTLFDGTQIQGEYCLRLDTRDLASGMYYVQMQYEGSSIIRQLFVAH